MSDHNYHELFEMIKEHNRRKDACPRHFFPRQTGGYSIGQKLRCINCDEDFSLTDASYYVRGYIAAGGNSDDVMPDWGKKNRHV